MTNVRNELHEELLNDEEKKLVDNYRKATEIGKKHVSGLLEFCAKEGEEMRKEPS